MRFVLFLCLAIISNETLGQDFPRFTYKGVPLGVSQAEFKIRLPDYICKDWRCEYFHSECVRRLSQDECKSRNSYANKLVDGGLAHFYRDKLVYMNLNVELSNIDRANHLAGALQAEYGRPQFNKTKVRMKTGLVEESLSWRWAQGVETLTFTSDTYLGNRIAFEHEDALQMRIENEKQRKDF